MLTITRQLSYALMRHTSLPLLCLVASLSCATTRWDPLIEPTRTLLPRAAAAPVPQLTVVVRYAYSPTRAASGTEVRLAPDGVAFSDASVIRSVADSAGFAHFPGLGAGLYTLDFRRVGTLYSRTVVTVPRACASLLEVYLVTQSCDLGDCPASPPAHAHFTTCALAP